MSLAKSESADSGVGAEPGEEEAEAERRVIRPDDTAVRRLLNFDEVIVDNIRWWLLLPSIHDLSICFRKKKTNTLRKKVILMMMMLTID